MPSFDIVSEPCAHEIQNAFDQSQRELSQRYDFKGTKSEITSKDDEFEIVANSEERVKAALEVFKEKLIKRKVSLKFLDIKEVCPKGGNMFSLKVNIKKGIEKDQAKIIVQKIKNEKSLKVTPSIQGECVRVTGKKRDDLQETISLLKNTSFDIELDYNNFRE